MTRGVVLLACFAAAAATQSDLPDGEGKAQVQKACIACHDLSPVTGSRMSAERWAATVGDMVSRGANVSDDDFDVVVNYLAKNFGRKVNVNNASVKELVYGLGFSKDAAQALVDYRSKNGDFKILEDIKKVPGVDAKTIDEKKDKIAF